MPTVAVKIYLEDPYQEFLIAELADLDFESFEQEESYVLAYIPAARWDDVRREHVETWLAGFGASVALEEHVIDDRDWNEQWEETIQPLAVGPFVIKPTWRDLPPEYGDRILLEIDPKMSFGTGYHESTRLMLHLLTRVRVEGARVLDAGTGTGLLAVAAAKLGASHVDAFDIDPWSQENALENVYLNGVADRVRIYGGAIESVPRNAYELIFANINLNVILGLLGRFKERMKPSAALLVSGVLRTDREKLVKRAALQGFALRTETVEGEWWSGVLVANE